MQLLSLQVISYNPPSLSCQCGGAHLFQPWVLDDDVLFCVSADFGLHVWGNSEFGQLGLGSTDNQVSGVALEFHESGGVQLVFQCISVYSVVCAAATRANAVSAGCEATEGCCGFTSHSSARRSAAVCLRVIMFQVPVLDGACPSHCVFDATETKNADILQCGECKEAQRVLFSWGDNRQGQCGLGTAAVSCWWVDASAKFGDPDENSLPASLFGGNPISAHELAIMTELGTIDPVDPVAVKPTAAPQKLTALSLLDMVRKQVTCDVWFHFGITASASMFADHCIDDYTTG